MSQKVLRCALYVRLRLGNKHDLTPEKTGFKLSASASSLHDVRETTTLSTYGLSNSLVTTTIVCLFVQTQPTLHRTRHDL